MRKILMAFMALFLGVSLNASDQSGVIVGFHFNKAFAKSKMEAVDGISDDVNAPNHNAWRYGLLLGYEEFASPELGVRYYGVFDFGNKYENSEDDELLGGYKIFTYNFNFNVDVVRDFVMNSGMRYGFFAGVSGGYSDSRVQFKDNSELTLAGLDFGFNAGVRIGYGPVNTEIYGHFSVLGQDSKASKEFKDDTGATISTYDFNVKQPYQVGLRLIYSF